MKREMKRKGFTLVELLIVIVVIGILSAMMMMSSTEAVTSSKASNIVANLRNIKTAALALYADSMDAFTSTTTATNKKTPSMALVKPYLNGENIPDLDDYAVATNTAAGDSWYVICEIKGTPSEIAQIKQKLKGRAKSLGLVGWGGQNGKVNKSVQSGGTFEAEPKEYNLDQCVALLIR